MNRLPIILYAWKPGTGPTYIYPQAISSEHCVGLLESLGPESPIHRGLSGRVHGNHRYLFSGREHTALWVAEASRPEGEREAYNRVVFLVVSHGRVTEGDIDYDRLWNIADDASPNDLFYELMESQGEPPEEAQEAKADCEFQQTAAWEGAENRKAPEGEFRSIAHAYEFPSAWAPLPHAKEESPAPFLPRLTGIKHKAAWYGLVCLFLGGTILGTAGLCFSCAYVFPAVSQVAGKCPLVKGEESFLALTKKDLSIACPFGTPVYDENFDKVGSVNRETPKNVEVMLLPDAREDRKSYHEAVYHYQPRKIVAIFKLIVQSTESEAIRDLSSQTVDRLKTPASKMMSRTCQIVRESYPPAVQAQIFKAFADAEFCDFMLSPLRQNLEDLKLDLENYSWGQTLRSREAVEVKDSLLREWSSSDKGSDLLSVAKGIFSRFIFEWDITLSGMFEEAGAVAINRLEAITAKSEVKSAIRKSAYSLATQIAEDIRLTHEGSLWKGKYAQNLEKRYAQKADYLTGKLQERGISLARHQILSLMNRMEKDDELGRLWKESEPLVQKELGQLVQRWVQQFFPEGEQSSNSLHVLAQALMREVLYGKPEPVIILRYGSKRRNVPLVRGY